MRTLAILVALCAAGWIFGTPHLLISYQCHGPYSRCSSYSRCEYVGIEGWRPLNTGNCPYIRLFPIKWNPFA